MALTAAGGVALYLLACTYLYFSGRAVIGALAAPPPGDPRHLLAPAASLAAHVVSIGAAVVAGLTTREISRVGWPIGLLLAVWGARGAAREADRRWIRDVLAVAAVGAVPICGPLLFGMLEFPGSPAWDGWAGAAYAQYLYDNPLGAEGGLAPLYQFAAHLVSTRYSAPALMGYLAAPLLASGLARDVQQGANLVLGAGAFVYAGACTWAWRAHRSSGAGATAYALLCVSSYWMIRLFVANNFDQLLFLAMLPALAATRFLGRAPGSGFPVLVGLLLAGELVAYPELTPAACLLAAAGAAAAMTEPEASIGRVLRASLAAVLAAAAISAPLAMRQVRFFSSQLATGLASGARPGAGIFPELLAWRELPINLLGFKIPPGATGTAAALMTGALLTAALGFTVLLVRGCAAAARRREERHLVAVLLVMLAGCVFFLWRFRYDYGAYKLAASSWWLLAYFLHAGIRSAPMIPIGRARILNLPAAAMAVLLFVYGGTTVGYYWYLDHLGYRSLVAFKAARDEVPAPPGSTIFSSVTEHRASMWTTYFLRDRPVVMLGMGGYMMQEHVLPFMRRSAPPWCAPVAGDLVLVDAATASCAGEAPAWQNDKLAAIRLGPSRPVVLGISSYNVQGTSDGKPFTWMGSRAAELRIAAPVAADAVLVAQVVPGASAASPAMLQVSGDREQRVVAVPVEGARLEVPLSLHAGVNELRLLALGPAGETAPAASSAAWKPFGIVCVALRLGAK